MDEEEGVKPVLNRKLKTRVGNLEELAKELNRTDFYEALGVEEWPPYRTCVSCSWLKRERGIEVCEEHMKLLHGQVRPSKGQKMADVRPSIKSNKDILERRNKMSNNSYNAGYHRGLNSEYHDRDVCELYKEWVEGTRFLLVPTTNDPVAFEEGFDDGISDYIEANKDNKEGLAATTAGWGENE